MDPTADLDGPALDFANCTYTVKVKQKGATGKSPRKLIANVSASIPSGVVLAVMGPSGAGKTTLLNMLMLERCGGVPEGVVTLGGHRLTLDLYMKHCAVVTQHDCLWWSLTVAEHISIALALYQPELTTSERIAYLDKLVDDVGLRSCMHIKAGNALFKGLSGGQKRRLSLAIVLAKKPLVIFMDEPTTGLDSCAAASIMTFLKATALRERISIFCTIHAPSASVFNGFDQVLFITGGRPAYLGPGAALADYVASAGEPLPPNTNPADHMLDLINQDFSPPTTVDRLVSMWRPKLPSQTPNSRAALPEKKTAGPLQQVSCLLKKHSRLVITDHTLYLGRLIAFPVATTFFGIVYVHGRERDQGQVEARLRVGMWCLCAPALLSVVTVFALNQELVAVRREVKDGMYSVPAFVLATSILQAPLMLVLGFGCMVPAIYPIGDVDWGRFHIAWFMTSAHLLCFEQFAQLLSLYRIPLVGMLLYLLMWFIFFLFCGLQFDPVNVIWPIRAVDYFSPSRLALPTLTHCLFIGEPDYSGAVLCNSTVAGCLPGGYHCPDGGVSMLCFGVSGAQILDSLGVRYPSVSSRDESDESFAKLLGLAAFIKLLFLFGLMYQMHQVDPPSDPPSMPSADGLSRAVEAAPAAASSTELSRVVESVNPQGMEEGLADDGGSKTAASNGGVKGQRHKLLHKLRGTSWVASFKGPAVEAGFTFRHCSYTVMVKPPKGEKGKRPKKLIDDVSGKVPPGHVLAIMGPSGAGKTTLLGMLMLDNLGGVPDGEVTLGGNKFTLEMYTKHASVVEQTDQLWWPLSPRDHITLAVQLYQKHLSKAEQAVLVDNLLKNTGLTSAQHTKVGNVFIKGLSGGQKRRLSLAISVTKRPHVIFLDEPTSGLDAAAASSIMVYLKELARAERVSILCTIHQPSSSVFAGFDRVLFLAGGRTAYNGAASGITGFLSRVGKPAAAGANPADYMLDLINKDFGDEATVGAVVETWKKEELAISTPSPCRVAEKERPCLGLQIAALLRKDVRLLLLDPISYTLRAIVYMVVTTFFAVVYIKTRSFEQTQVLSRVWLSNWLLGVTSLTGGFVVIYLMNIDFAVVRREVKDGMYHPATYVLAKTCMQLPMLALLAVCALFPAVYPIGKWAGEGFVRAWATCFAAFASLEFTAELMSIAFANPIHGMLSYLLYWFVSFLFCLVLVAENDVVWPLRLLVYVSPLRWAFEQLAWAMIIETPDYDGVEDCTTNTDGLTGIASTGPLTGQTVSCPRNFYCPDDLSGLMCFGRTGRQIVTSLSMSFSAIGSYEAGDKFGRDICLTIAIAIAFKLCYLGLFVFKSRPSSFQLLHKHHPTADSASSSSSVKLKRRA